MIIKSSVISKIVERLCEDFYIKTEVVASCSKGCCPAEYAYVKQEVLENYIIDKLRDLDIFVE